jgi:hypothetical protein
MKCGKSFQAWGAVRLHFTPWWFKKNLGLKNSGDVARMAL